VSEREREREREGERERVRRREGQSCSRMTASEQRGNNSEIPLSPSLPLSLSLSSAVYMTVKARISEYGTYKTDKARIWPWLWPLSGENIHLKASGPRRA